MTELRRQKGELIRRFRFGLRSRFNHAIHRAEMAIFREKINHIVAEPVGSMIRYPLLLLHGKMPFELNKLVEIALRLEIVVNRLQLALEAVNIEP